MNRPKTPFKPPAPFVIQPKAAFKALSAIAHPKCSDQVRLSPQAPPVFRAGATAKVVQAKALAAPLKQERMVTPPPPFKPGPARPVQAFMATRRAVVQRAGICSAIADAFRSCWGGGGGGANAYTSVEMQATDDIASLLPPWGAAVSVGYHCTASWDDIRRTGVFRACGGQFGPGIYIVKSDWAWVQSMYSANKVVLEVGYTGDMSTWAANTLVTAVLAYKKIEGAEGRYDVVKTENDTGTLNQVCYKLNGPSGINLSNFRFRRVG